MSDEVQPTSIRLPADLHRALHREADLERRTVSWIIVDVMDRWVKWREQNRDAKLGAETEIKGGKK
jgi:predicted transcriptional regulator